MKFTVKFYLNWQIGNSERQTDTQNHQHMRLDSILKYLTTCYTTQRWVEKLNRRDGDRANERNRVTQIERVEERK